MNELLKLQQEIAETCAKAGRSRNDVRVVAVSKLQPFAKIENLYKEGQSDFGENYVQELVGKISEGERFKIHWHLIGHLQKNKIKNIIGKCDLIHSVDSIGLASALSKAAVERGITQNILLQINLAGEESKEGFSKEDFLKNWQSLAELPSLKIHGLMTMPPLQNKAEQNRIYFAELRELLKKLNSEGTAHPLNDLSMGTSHDFVVAIEEGATLIRVGTRLFGERPN